MKRYSEYKDSGVKWIGEIPGHWKIVRLKFVTENLDYLREPISAELRERKNPQYDYYGASGIIDKIDHYNVDDKVLLIGEDGANLLMRNLPLVYRAEGKFWVNNHAHILKTRLNDYSFFAHLLESQDYTLFVTGTAQPKLSQFNLGNVPLPISPINEQKIMGKYLDSKVAKIDEYISIAEKKIAALEELKQTIIAEAVTRGIHKDVPMKDSGVKWIGMIPEHWDLIRAQNMVDCRKAGAWGEDSRKDERDRVCLRIADFDYSICRFKRTGDYTIRNYKQEQISSLYLNKGDILIEKSGGGEKTPVGRAILYDLDFYQPLYANFMEKITLREFASSSFYVYLLRTFYAKGCVWKYIKQTTGLQNLDLRAMLGSETFPVPPLPEQQEIVTYIEAKVANINQLCQAERSQIEKLKEYKQRLISDVVTGKVKVTND